MANVLTNLAADIYKAADVVGRELVGFIPSSTVNGGSEAAALGDTVRSHFTRPATVNSISPSMTIPEGDDQTVDNKTLTLNKTASVQIPWTGEDMRHVNNGSGFETIYGDQIRQAMRAITNQIEGDLGTEAYTNASRAYGTAGTTPFASNFNNIPQVRKILADNGMPFDGSVSLVMNTSAGANLRSLSQLQKANEAGGDTMLRQGTLLDLQGFMLKESDKVQSHTAGTASGASPTYQVNFSGGYSAGATTIAVDTGSGTIKVGDVVKFANHDDLYVVATALSGGEIVLAAPGLRESVADNEAVTVQSSYAGNVGFHRAAIELAMRPYANPQGGDAAVDRMDVIDERSGLAFTISAYKGYKKAMFDVHCVYDVKAWKPEFIATLLG